MNKTYGSIYSSNQFRLLKRLYTLYDETVHHDTEGDAGWYCHKGCAACCTCNVTLTSLEMAWFWNGLSPNEREAVEDAIRRQASLRRYRPRITTNGLAALCMADEAIPEEENDPTWGACPLLTDSGICTVYDLRPFGCRLLLSEIDCRKQGYARMPPLILTLNNLFMQYIEHLDAGGVTGNLTDMIEIAASGGLNSPSGDLNVASGDLNTASRDLNAASKDLNAASMDLNSVSEGLCDERWRNKREGLVQGKRIWNLPRQNFT